MAATAVELIVFDCDGVLVDSETIATRVSQRVLSDLGRELSLDEVAEHLAGASDEVYAARIAELTGRSLEPGWDDEYSAWYYEAFRSDPRAIPGIREALEELSLPRCVASNSSHRWIRDVLGLTDLLGHFGDRIFSADDVERGKPAPDLFLWAAQRLGVRAENCVVVEDSVFGVQAARAAGMRVLAYAGVTPAARLEGEAIVVFDDMTDLPRLIEEAA
ncbi:MAG: HAD family hydrolase [Microbacterium sp.]